MNLGNKTDIRNVYPELVHRHYRLNPEEDMLLEHSSLLDAGMTVILATGGEMFDLTQMRPKDITPRVMAVNRWCTVGDDLEVYDGIVMFTAHYSDGTRAYRRYPDRTQWLAKKDSKYMSPLADYENRKAAIEAIVLNALKKVSENENPAVLMELADEAANKIVGLK